MSEEVKVRRGSLDDLTPDDRNMNKHTSYGMSLIEKSIRKHKFGRSILVDKNDRIIGGNGVTETAASIGATKTIVVETNGTRLVPAGVDWVTVSPKGDYTGDIIPLALYKANEVKVVFDGHTMKDPTFGIKADYYYMQPCDTGDPLKNKVITEQCVEYVKRHPLWKISLQTQKILNVR